MAYGKHPHFHVIYAPCCRIQTDIDYEFDVDNNMCKDGWTSTYALIDPR